VLKIARLKISAMRLEEALGLNKSSWTHTQTGEVVMSFDGKVPSAFLSDREVEE